MCRQYLEVSSTSNGRAIYYEATGTGQDYTAPITIQWEQDKIVLTQSQAASAPGANSSYAPATFTCTPDSNNLLRCEYRAQSNVSDTFYLRKITQRNDR
jgi:hypothetical protein